MERIQLPATLALLLRANLCGARQWPGEGCLEFGLVHDLAPDIADDAAEPGAADAQFAPVTLAWA
jgi:hypothetical protein